MPFSYRPLVLDDAPLVWDIYSEPTVQHQAVLHVEEMQADSIEPMLRRWLTDGRQYHYLVTDESGIPLGLNQLFAVDRIARTAESGILLLPHARGRGAAAQIHEHQLFVARELLGLNRLTAQVAAYNTHSLHIMQKLGFQQDGVRRRALYRGDEFHDIFLFSKSVPA